MVFLSFKGLISEKTLLALLRSGYEPDADGKVHWKLFLLYLLERQQLEHCMKQAGDGYRVMVLYRVFGFCSGLCKYSRKKNMMSKMESRRRKGRSQGQCTGTTQKATNKQIWDGIADMGFIYDGKTPSLSSVCDVKTCENVQGGEYTTEKPDRVSSSSILFVELT